MRRTQTITIRLPKYICIDDVDIKTIAIDDSWPVQVKDGDSRTIGEMSFGAAKQKFGRGERHG